MESVTRSQVEAGRGSRSGSPINPVHVAKRPGPPPRISEDRAKLLWARKAFVVGLSLACALGVYVVGSILPAKYGANATVLITAGSSAGISPREAVQASNDLAAQYVHLVNTPAVINAARLRPELGNAQFSVDASTVAAQNLVQISIVSTDPQIARIAAAATANAFQKYVDDLTRQQADKSQSALVDLSKELDDQIKQAKADVAGAPSESLSARLQALTDLQGRRSGIQQQIASQASDSPTATIIASTGASKVSPKPLLYAGVTLVVVFLLAAEFVVRRAPKQQ